MNVSDAMIPSLWLWLGFILYFVALSIAVARAPWHRLRENEHLNVFLGATVVLLLIWNIRAPMPPGLEFHLLCTTTVTLMFGWPLGVASASLAQVGITLDGGASWESYPLNALLNGILPALVTAGIHRLAEWKLPHHFFIYIFVCAFAAGGVAMSASRVVAFGVLLTGATEATNDTVRDILRYLPLMLFPEALLNGMFLTLLVVYRPHWVSTFDDLRYLKGR